MSKYEVQVVKLMFIQVYLNKGPYVISLTLLNHGFLDKQKK